MSKDGSRRSSTIVRRQEGLPKSHLRRSGATATGHRAVAPPHRAVGPARQRHDSSARPTRHAFRRLAVAPCRLPSRRDRRKRRPSARRLVATGALTVAEVAVDVGSSTETTRCRRHERSHACQAVASLGMPSSPSSGMRTCRIARRALTRAARAYPRTFRYACMRRGATTQSTIFHG